MWQKLIQDESLVMKDVRIFNEDVMEVSVMKKEKGGCEGAGKTNIFIACFTTALARLKLSAELKKLGEQVLYYEFGSAAPKSCCYQTMSGKSECKNKGTKSSFEINQVLNCDSMMQDIQQELANPLQCRRLLNIDIKDHFVIDSTHKTVSLKDLVKVFGVNWDKRVVENIPLWVYLYGKLDEL